MGFWNKEEEKKKAGEINGLAKTEPAPSANLQPAVTSGGLMTEQGLAPERSLSKDPLTTRFGTIRSALSEGTVIQGKLTFDTPVRIDGKLSGEIFSSEALIVGEKGSIDAQVEVNALIVMGRVKGDIIAKERVELMAGGVIEATLNTPCFVMEEGARFEGKCVMNTLAETVRSKSETKSEPAPATEPDSKSSLKSEVKDAVKTKGAQSAPQKTESRLH